MQTRLEKKRQRLQVECGNKQKGKNEFWKIYKEA